MIEASSEHITVICLCGQPVVLQVEGGQYPEFYSGRCTCGRIWELANLSEILQDLDTEPVGQVNDRAETAWCDTDETSNLN